MIRSEASVILHVDFIMRFIVRLFHAFDDPRSYDLIGWVRYSPILVAEDADDQIGSQRNPARRFHHAIHRPAVSRLRRSPQLRPDWLGEILANTCSRRRR